MLPGHHSEGGRAEGAGLPPGSVAEPLELEVAWVSQGLAWQLLHGRGPSAGEGAWVRLQWGRWRPGTGLCLVSISLLAVLGSAKIGVFTAPL